MQSNIFKILLSVGVVSVLCPVTATAYDFTHDFKNDLTSLQCDISTAMTNQYPDREGFKATIRGAVKKAAELRGQFPPAPIQSDDETFTQRIYDQFISNDFEYYYYPALIADTAANNNSSDFLGKLLDYQEGAAERHVPLKDLALDPQTYIRTIENDPMPDEKKAIYNGGVMGPMLLHTGMKTEEFAKQMLQASPASLSYRDVFKMALSITHGDAVSAVGVIATVLGVDAASPSHRNRASIINSKIKPMLALSPDEQKKSHNFNYQPGFNYHFWCYLAETWARNSLFLGARSYVYENLIQKDPQEGSADQAAIAAAKQVQYLFENGKARRRTCVANQLNTPSNAQSLLNGDGSQSAPTAR